MGTNHPQWRVPLEDVDTKLNYSQMPLSSELTTVDELSYTPPQEEKTRDAEQAVATGRKTWKALKGKGEAVWPPLL